MAGTKPKRAKSKPRPRVKVTPPAEVVVEEGPPFGPAFFTRLLPRLIRSCPCATDREPVCMVRLRDGEDLDLVEVLAVSERFVVLAVFEGVGEDGVERTEDDLGIEAVPYELILRVGVRRGHTRARLGFHFPREELAAAAREVGEHPDLVDASFPPAAVTGPLAPRDGRR